MFHDESCHFFRKVLLLNNVVKEFASLTVFEHKEANLVPLPNFIELNDIWMVLKKDKKILG